MYNIIITSTIITVRKRGLGKYKRLKEL